MTGPRSMPISDYQALKTKSPGTEILKQAEQETEIRGWISIISIKHCRPVSQQEDNWVYPSLACLRVPGWTVKHRESAPCKVQ